MAVRIEEVWTYAEIVSVLAINLLFFLLFVM